MTDPDDGIAPSTLAVVAPASLGSTTVAHIVDFYSEFLMQVYFSWPGVPFVVFEAGDVPELLEVMATRSRAGMGYVSFGGSAGGGGAIFGDVPGELGRDRFVDEASGGEASFPYEAGAFYSGWPGLATIEALAAHVVVTGDDGRARLELAPGYYAVCITSRWDFWVSQLHACLNTEIVGNPSFGSSEQIPASTSLCYRADDDESSTCRGVYEFSR